MGSGSLWDAAFSKETVTVFAAVAVKNSSQVGAVGRQYMTLTVDEVSSRFA